MSVSLVITVQVSCFLVQNIVSQYPPMYGIPGLPMPQMMPYQQPYFDFDQHSNPDHGHKKKHSKRKEHRDGTSYSSSCSSSRSASEEESDDECSCDLTCDQCTIDPPSCCIAFCSSCQNTNQGVVFLPYPYPVLINEPIQKSTQQNFITQTESLAKANPTDKVTKKVEVTETTTVKEEKKSNTVTEKIEVTTKPTEKEEKKLKESTKSEEIIRAKSEEISTKKHDESTTKKPEDTNQTKLSHSKRTGSCEVEINPNATNRKKNYEHKDIIFKVPTKGGGTKYILTSLRKINESWLPKYGIVPIPKNVAAEVMTNLRGVKYLPSVRETQNIKVDSITPLHESLLKKSLLDDKRSGRMRLIDPQSNFQAIAVGDSGITNEYDKLKESDAEFQTSSENNKASDLPFELVKKIYQY